MRTSHVSLPAFLALACALCALPARAQLTPENKADNPYVPQAGDLAAQGWSVLNAADEETQNTALSYTLGSDKGGAYLDFSGDANPLGGLETVYLALGIADTDGSPIEMTRDDTNAFRTDNVYAKVRFERSANAPSMDDLRTMYPSYPHGNTTVAPKLGLYVDADGYFCVSRIRAGETATQEDIVFEFCTTKVRYADVFSSEAEGAVVVRIEFQTFAATTKAPSVRGFRIWVRDAADDAAQETCLTAGLGYRWTQDDETKGYTFDFSSLEQGDGCDWFYAIDSAQAMFDQNMNSTALEALNQLAFSATGGGFYSAWLALNGSALTQETLENYDFGEFNAFLQGNPMDNLVTDWASRYGVDLMQYGTSKTRRFMAADGADRTHGFNAFLLDMDPKAQVEQRLQVTGIVPAADGSVTLTVRGPEGCVLKNALNSAGILHVTRAETLEGLATAASEPISVGELAFGGGSATMVLPPAGDGAPLPFIKVTLRPNEPPAAE